MHKKNQDLEVARLKEWLNEILFTPNWWILFFTTIGTLIVWLFILNKNRIIEITLYGILIAFVTTMLDLLGVVLQLWHYPYTLTPLPIIDEINMVQMPIIYMIIYQYFVAWKPFIIAITISAFIFAFMFEPILIWLKIYEPHHWKHIYSFPLYIIMAIALKWIVNKFKQLDENYTK